VANTKPKPEEPPKRSPGKSKFVFPKREAPPVDNTYFDRLFSELQEQNQTSEPPPLAAEVPFPDQLTQAQATENQDNQATIDGESDVSFSPVAVTSEAVTLDIKANQIKELEVDPTSERIETPQPDLISTTAPEISVGPALQVTPLLFCKPETSSYVDRLKLKYRLSKGEANVLKYLLGATHDKGETECYITIPKLAEAAGITARGCQLTLKSLQMREFVVRIEEYDPSSRLGIKLQVNLIALNYTSE
jgi:hypothetical protein